MKNKLTMLLMALCITTTVASAHDRNQAAMAGFDAAFMEKMVMHHEMAMPMFDMCTAKAVHDELKQFCAKGKSDQQKESAMMKSWMGEPSAGKSMNRGGMQHDSDPSMKPNAQREHAGMSKLQMGQMKQEHQKMQQASGADFEKLFLPAMAKHHQMAIKMAQPCPAKAQKDELRNLCKEIVTNQTAERQQLLTWKRQWNGEKGRR